MTNFSDWLRNELDQRNWTQAELSRRSNVSPAQITRVLTGERGLGDDSLKGIAKAFNLPITAVYQAAGILPMASPKTALIAAIDHILADLPEDEQVEVLEYARLRQRLASQKGHHAQTKNRQSSKNTASP